MLPSESVTELNCNLVPEMNRVHCTQGTSTCEWDYMTEIDIRKLY